MVSNFHVHQPYVLTVLSAPLDRPDGPGRYSIGEVFGQQAGSKKRKRSELSVGIDGDAANLFDVSSSNLITSYPIPPQSYFTCAPYSVRCKVTDSKDVIRYTFISTHDTLNFKKKITLFKDVLTATGDTISTSVSCAHDFTSPIVHLSTTSPKTTEEKTDGRQMNASLVAVTKNGDIGCFNVETLKSRWTTGASALTQGLPTASTTCQLDFVQAALAADVMDGIFGGKSDVFALFPQPVDRDGFNPDVLVAVVTAQEPHTNKLQRYLQVLAILPENMTQRSGQNGLFPVFSSPIPNQTELEGRPSEYRLEIRLGSFQELCDGTLLSYTLKDGSVRLESRFYVQDMNSCLRLSKSSVLAATTDSLSVYNPAYRALQASASATSAVGVAGNAPPYQATDPCTLVSYFWSREIAVGVRGSALVAVQVEPPKTRSTKRQAEGLLIDSIGRGIPLSKQKQAHIQEEQSASAFFSHYLPGSVSDDYWTEYQEEITKLDAIFAAHDIAQFETRLAARFGVALAESKPASAGKTVDDEALPEWLWPPTRDDYPRVDRRWVLYVLSKVFAWTEPQDGQTSGSRLTCTLTEGNLLNYLADAGHLTVSNLQSALRSTVPASEQLEEVLAEELPRVLATEDPTSELLLSYLSGTRLGPTELIASIRLIVQSLDLIQDSKAKAITANGEGGPDEILLGMEIDQAEKELNMTESRLNETEFCVGDASTRAKSLSVAFSKLALCSALHTVKAMRRLLKPEETLSLINILRMELVQDGWTTRYLDNSQPKADEPDGPPDGSIKLIADLLCRCIDAIGFGGFLANDSVFAAMTAHVDTAEFLKQFIAEVSVALEGIEEAVCLRGILTEVVKYGTSLQKTQTTRSKTKGPAPIKHEHVALDTFTSETRALPLGLKATVPRVSHEKIVSGGEIVQRSKRETAMLYRKSLGPYVIERVGPKM